MLYASDIRQQIKNLTQRTEQVTDYFFYFIKVLLLGIFSVHTPGYKNELNCSFNQFTWVVTHPVRGIKGSDLLGFDSTAVKK